MALERTSSPAPVGDPRVEDARRGAEDADGRAADDLAEADTTGANVWSAAAMIGDPSSTALKDLADQRAQLRKKRDEVNRQIRNEERKRARLIERARHLSNTDLLSILGSRAAAKAKTRPAARGGSLGNARANVANRQATSDASQHVHAD